MSPTPAQGTGNYPRVPGSAPRLPQSCPKALGDATRALGISPEGQDLPRGPSELPRGVRSRPGGGLELPQAAPQPPKGGLELPQDPTDLPQTTRSCPSSCPGAAGPPPSRSRAPPRPPPCSSLEAAARRVELVLPGSVGVPGRLLPRELLAEPLRSRLGGVFFFWGRPGGGRGGLRGTPQPPPPGVAGRLHPTHRHEEGRGGLAVNVALLRGLRLIAAVYGCV